MTNNISLYLANILASTSANDPLNALVSLIQQKIKIAASTTNVAGANAAITELPSLLTQLVDALMDRKRISPATILAMALIAASAGGHIVSDVGVLGTVSGSISITPGAY